MYDDDRRALARKRMLIDGFALAGAGLLTAGLWTVWPPLGMIGLGLLLLGAAIWGLAR